MLGRFWPRGKEDRVANADGHWPLFYRGCLGCVGVLKDWLIRTISAALRKGDTRLTLERVREQELVEASLADMAADIVSGEQQVAIVRS